MNLFYAFILIALAFGLFIAACAWRAQAQMFVFVPMKPDAAAQVAYESFNPLLWRETNGPGVFTMAKRGLFERFYAEVSVDVDVDEDGDGCFVCAWMSYGGTISSMALLSSLPVIWVRRRIRRRLLAAAAANAVGPRAATPAQLGSGAHESPNVKAGSSPAARRFCTNCGNAIPRDDRYCRECGASSQETVQQAPEQQSTNRVVGQHISEAHRLRIGRITAVVLAAQESDREGRSAAVVLIPQIPEIVAECREMSAENPAVLAFVANLLFTCTKWTLGDLSDGTVQKMSDSAWGILGTQLKTIPGAPEAYAALE